MARPRLDDPARIVLSVKVPVEMRSAIADWAAVRGLTISAAGRALLAIGLGVANDPGLRSPQRTAVYSIYDRDGRLLYIGCTGDIRKRLAQHRRSRIWWPEVDQIGVEWHPDRRAARHAEAQAIRERAPRWNRRAG